MAALSLQASAGNYTIEGNIAGHGGRILLLRPVTLEKSDTIGNVMTADGSFRFTGEVTDPFEVELMAVGTRANIPLFIEPGADIKVQADVKSRLADVSGGGELQQCRNRYNAIERAAALEADSISNYYRTTYDMNDYFWVVQLKGALQRASDRFEADEDRFLTENDNMVSASIVARKLPALTRSRRLPAKYAKLGPAARASERGLMLKEKADMASQITVGGIAPDFTMETPDGGTLTLHGVKGKVKILDFWASWCGPCRAENPNVKKIYDKYHDKGLEIVSVSLDTSRAPWIKAIEKDGMNWLHCSDLDKATTARDVYKVYGIPYMLILDENNRIISEGLRGERLEEFIASQFTE